MTGDGALTELAVEVVSADLAPPRVYVGWRLTGRFTNPCFVDDDLLIDAGTRKVENVETLTTYARQGLASALWVAANAEGECFHAVEHHRTPEGDAFAQAVGGETIAPELDVIDECFICCGDLDDDDTY